MNLLLQLSHIMPNASSDMLIDSAHNIFGVHVQPLRETICQQNVDITKLSNETDTLKEKLKNSTELVEKLIDSLVTSASGRIPMIQEHVKQLQAVRKQHDKIIKVK